MKWKTERYKATLELKHGGEIDRFFKYFFSSKASVENMTKKASNPTQKFRVTFPNEGQYRLFLRYLNSEMGLFGGDTIG